MRIERSHDMLWIRYLHIMMTEQMPDCFFVKTLAASLCFGMQSERHLTSNPLLKHDCLSLLQKTEVLLVPAANHITHEVQELIATCRAAFSVGLDRLHTKTVP